MAVSILTGLLQDYMRSLLDEVNALSLTLLCPCPSCLAATLIQFEVTMTALLTL